MKRLEGKVALVTGGAQGIGLALARGLAMEGAKIVVTDILDVDAAVDEIRGCGVDAFGKKADITRHDDLSALFEAASARLGPIEILVNNASLFASLTPKPFFDLSEQEWDDVMRVNVRGAFQCIKAALPGMITAGRGKIVNISSGTFFYGAPGLSHYVASKGAIIGLTRTLARELGDRNICVNAIAPGLTESEGVQANTAFHQIRAPTIASRAIKRDMLPSDLVGTAVFLSGSDSDFITGQLFNVDGGRSMY